MTDPVLVHRLEALERRLAALEAAVPEQIEAAIDADANALLKAAAKF